LPERLGSVAEPGTASTVETGGEQQEDLDQFFTLSLEMLCVAGLDGYFKRLNPAFERTLGYTLEELQSRPFLDFVHPDDREATLAEVARLATGLETISFENRYHCKDGSYVWLAWKCRPSVETGVLYAAAHDITERKRADAEIVALNGALAVRAASLQRQNRALAVQSEELEAKQASLARQVDINRAVLDASGDGIRLVDLDGRTVLANFAIEKLTTDVFGLPGDATLDERSVISDRLTDPASYLATIGAIAADPECSTQDIFELSDARRAFQRDTAPVRDSDGELIGRIIVVREVSAEHEAARLKSELVATVSRVNETLEATVAERTELAERRAHALVRSNAELEQFASVAAHDLQEPLRKIRMYCERVERRRDEIPEEVQSDIARMEAASGRMQNLISDLLDLARINSRGRELVANDLVEVAREVVVDLEAHIADVGASIEIEHLPVVLGDRVQLRQILQNLISNALKFHREGVPPRVRMATETSEHGRCVVTVEDNGIGLDDKYAERIFGTFQRLHGRGEYDGTGIGLSIARKIAWRHDGDITATGVPGEGATFRLALPLAPTTPADTHQPDPAREIEPSAE
jgi:PAS domain S-box-containing protein